MSGAVYGGDEVGALVIDVGSYLTKVGFAGEDVPKAVYPTAVGCMEKGISSNGMGMDTTEDGLRTVMSYAVGTSSVHYPRRDMEIRNPLVDGLIEDWDVYENLLNYSFSNVLRVDMDNPPPVMVSEVAWNTPHKREKLAELLFEKFKVPALYFCKDAVLTAFASGRSTALVINSGASFTSVVPVYDGFVLYKGVKRSEYAGNTLTKQFRVMFEERKKIGIIPAYMMSGKVPVGEGEPAKYTAKAGLSVTKSYHDYMTEEVIRDFQASVSRIATPSYNLNALTLLPTTHFEFPNGYNDAFGIDRYQVPELLFDPDFFTAGDGPGYVADTTAVHGARGSSVLNRGVQHLVVSSVDSCDVDVHSNLWSSIILTGGNTLLNGYSERLLVEIQKVVPVGTRFKAITPPSVHERNFSSWIGGSILASLGSFQQMWVSRAEYDEQGKGVIEKKCP